MKKLLTTALILFILGPGTAQEINFLLWNQNGLEVRINDQLSVGVNEKVHYHTGSGQINLKFGDVFVKKHFTEWFELGVTGRMLLFKEMNDWQQENRVMVFGNVSAEQNNLEIEFSNRVEYRMFELLNDHFRHRQMLSVELLPFIDLRWLKFYLAEETFIRFDEKQLQLARFYTGTIFSCSDSVGLKVYYVLEKSRKPLWWNTSNILGLNLNISL